MLCVERGNFTAAYAFGQHGALLEFCGTTLDSPGTATLNNCNFSLHTHPTVIAEIRVADFNDRKEALVEKLEALMDSWGLNQPEDCLNLKYDSKRGFLVVGLGPGTRHDDGSYNCDEATFIRSGVEGSSLKSYTYFTKPSAVSKEERAKAIADIQETFNYYQQCLRDELKDYPEDQKLLMSSIENSLGQAHRTVFTLCDYQQFNMKKFYGLVKFVKMIMYVKAKNWHDGFHQLSNGYVATVDESYAAKNRANTGGFRVHELAHTLVHPSVYSKEKMRDIANVLTFKKGQQAAFGNSLRMIPKKIAGRDADYYLQPKTDSMVDTTLRCVNHKSDSRGGDSRASIKDFLEENPEYGYTYKDFLIHVFTSARPFQVSQ